MTTKELFDKYVKEVCPICRNKQCSLCNITITQNGKDVEAKCGYYEKEK